MALEKCYSGKMKPDYSAGSWLQFFLSAGIAKDSAETYAVTFSKNQINLDMLPEIKKEYLVDMGITLMGHIIAILRHAKSVHVEAVTKATLSPSSNGTKSVVKVMTKPKAVGAPAPVLVKENLVAVSKEKSDVAAVSTEVSSRLGPQPKSTSSTLAKLKPESTTLPQKRQKVIDDELVAKKIAVSQQKLVKIRQTKDPYSDDIIVKSDIGKTRNDFLSNNDDLPSSNGESVFNRLGQKTPSQPIPFSRTSVKMKQMLNSTLPQTTKSNHLMNGITKEPTVRFNSDTLTKPPSKRTSVVPKKIITCTMRADETPAKIVKLTTPYSSTVMSRDHRLQNTIHSRLGSTKVSAVSKKGVLSMNNTKRVRFGPTTQKAIPIEKVPGYRRNFRPHMDFSSQGSIGMSTGVFSRLGFHQEKM